MQEMTVKEKDNFFLNNPEIYRLCVGIQLCLIAGWEIRNVKNKLNSILNENFTEWQDKRHEIIKIFESIIKILSSKEQKDLFLKQIPTEFFAFFLHAPAAKRCRYENLVETFQENFIKPAIDYFDIKSTGNLLTQLKPGLQICHEKLAAIKRNVDSTRKNYLLFFMVIVFTAMVAASIYFYGFTHPFTFIFASILGSNFGFSIGAGYKLYSERKKAYSEYTLREWQTFIENKTLPNLTKVVIHNPHKQEKEIVYLPMDLNKANLQLERLATTNSDNSITSDSITRPIKRKHAPSPPETKNVIYRFFTSSEPVVCWPGASITGGFTGNVFSNDRTNVRKMWRKEEHRCLYAFFNRRQLNEVQGLKFESEEMTAYESQWNKGKITESTGESGLNELKHSHKIKNDYYQWEIKILHELYRCVGKYASTVLDTTGTAHTLVDFCLHLDKGPGKGRGFK